MRTIIDLTDEQVAGLAHFCERAKVSRAEAVRRAVTLLLRQETEESALKKALEEGFGLWKGRGISTDAYLAEIRQEWDEHERRFRL